jgi:hypothetical protein
LLIHYYGCSYIANDPRVQDCTYPSVVEDKKNEVMEIEMLLLRQVFGCFWFIRARCLPLEALVVVFMFLFLFI